MASFWTFFGKILSGLIIGIGYFIIGFTKNKQGLHDILAKTFVVKGSSIIKKGRNTSWIIFFISFLLFIIALLIPGNLARINQSANSSIETPISHPKANLDFSLKGISFKYPDNWEITDNSEIENGIGHNIMLEKIGINKNGVVTISWFIKELDLGNCLEIMKNSIKETKIYREAAFSENQTVMINSKLALKSTFNYSVLNINWTGEVYCFTLNGKTIVVLIQGADEVKNLNKDDFDVILKSIKTQV